MVFKRDTISGLAEELVALYKDDPEAAADSGFAMPAWLTGMRSFQGQRLFLLTVFDYLLELCAQLRAAGKQLARGGREV